MNKPIAPLEGPVRIASVILVDDMGRPARVIPFDRPVGLVEGQQVARVEVTMEIEEVTIPARTERRKGFLRRLLH